MRSEDLAQVVARLADLTADARAGADALRRDVMELLRFIESGQRAPAEAGERTPEQTGTQEQGEVQ